MSEELRIVDACTEEHFRAMSLIHALGWRDTYEDALPAEWMAEHVTDERWVNTFRQYAEEGVTTACCCTGGTLRSPALHTAPPASGPRTTVGARSFSLTPQGTRAGER